MKIMSEKLLQSNQYVIYDKKPLVREKNRICYGDMNKKCYLFMMILNNKTVDNIEVPNTILVQILTTGKNPKILKQGTRVGLYDAFSIGTIWLDRFLEEQ